MDSYAGEVRVFAFDYAPQGWAMCNGASLAQKNNQLLFIVIGTTYGGTDTEFNLPDLTGRAPVCVGDAVADDPSVRVHPSAEMGLAVSARPLGSTSGTPFVTLTTQQTPDHTHDMSFVNAASATAPFTKIPSNSVMLTRPNAPPPGGAGSNTLVRAIVGTKPAASLWPEVVGPAGQIGQHENRQPYLAMNLCISLNGTFPPKP